MAEPPDPDAPRPGVRIRRRQGKYEGDEGVGPVKSATEARGGRKGTSVLTVLLISLSLAIVALLILWLVYVTR